MDNSVAAFYDQLAADYHMIFADWRQATERQGTTLDKLIHTMLGAKPMSLLDCACGIGTQALGLSLRGYRVHGTDISPQAIARARQEATALGVGATFAVADMRRLEEVMGTFEVVISCDNSLPHLLTDQDLAQAAHGIVAKLAPGGLFLASTRDYDVLAQERPTTTPPRVFDTAEGRRIVFQVWDWSEEGHTYTVNHFIVQEDGGRWTTSHAATAYRALLQSELAAVLEAAGFVEVRWHTLEQTGYYQPIVTARKW